MTDAIRDAAQAKSELRQTEAAFDAMKRGAVESWMSSDPAQALLREEAYRFVNVIDQVRQRLIEVVNTGDMEEAAQAFRKSLNQPG